MLTSEDFTLRVGKPVLRLRPRLINVIQSEKL